MSWFWKYIFPALYGFITYVIIRILNDTVSGFRFWERDWRINLLEIVCCTGTGYIMMYAMNKLFRRFDATMQHTVNSRTLLYELLGVFIITELIANAIVTPMAAFTDDGLSPGDLATIVIVPLLFNLIYYAVVRSNKLLDAYVNKKLQLEKLTNDHLQTELKFLKAQYHPHFLFNALNTVYFQMDENIGEAKKSIEKFSELLRYQLYDQHQTVSISNELHYLQNFIELQKVRSSDRLKLTVHFDPALNAQQVYPLLFLPLVENAFKYVGGEYCISIEGWQKDSRIHFRVINSLPDLMENKRAGIGLENLRRRLELLYPSTHRFSTMKKENNFIAEMQLEI